VINLNKGVLIGVVSGLAAFIIFLILMFVSSDFDQNLINQVENGVPADKLIPQINKETDSMRLDAQKRLQANVVNTNLDKEDSESYMLSYKVEMKMISDYDIARKKYAKREINKLQFLNAIEEPKEYMKINFN